MRGLATHTVFYRRPTDTTYHVWCRVHGTLAFAQTIEERVRRDFPMWNTYIMVERVAV